MKMLRFFLFCCATLLASHPTHAQPQANISASKDNTLFQDASGGLSNGAGAHFYVGKTSTLLRRGLIAFDIAGNLPANAIVDSVKLRLSMSNTNVTNGAQLIQLHRVLADWGEGTSNALPPGGGGAPATSGDATWIHRFFNTTLWTTAGGDFAPAPSASQTVNRIGIYFWNTTPQMVADVQAWLNAPATNFGWLARGNESGTQTAKRFDTRENATLANRPQLTVFYHISTRVDNEQPLSPAIFHLAQNYPNPFNPGTTITFNLPTAADVKLQILDLSGREIATLAEGRFSAGKHRAQWNAEEHAGGIYFYRLQAGNYSTTKKLILLR
jgi:hypothetical protein